MALEHIVMHSDFTDSHDDDDEALALERLVAKDDFSDHNLNCTTIIMVIMVTLLNWKGS